MSLPSVPTLLSTPWLVSKRSSFPEAVPSAGCHPRHLEDWGYQFLARLQLEEWGTQAADPSSPAALHLRSAACIPALLAHSQ